MRGLRIFLLVLLGGLALDCIHLVMQGMNPINLVAADIYRWNEQQAASFFGVASSMGLLAGVLMLLYPAYWLLTKIGRMQSIRIGFLLMIAGSSVMLIRHTAGIMAGRILVGLAMGIHMFNSIPFVINCVPEDDRYFYGSVTIIIARSGPLLHALTFLGIDIDRVDEDKMWMVTLMFPAMVSLLGLLVSLVQHWDSPDSYYARLHPANE